MENYFPIKFPPIVDLIYFIILSSPYFLIIVDKILELQPPIDFIILLRVQIEFIIFIVNYFDSKGSIIVSSAAQQIEDQIKSLQIVRNFRYLGMHFPIQNLYNYTTNWNYLNVFPSIIISMDNQSTKITTSANPWTNKVKIRGQGKLNSIMNKYLNDSQQVLSDTQLTSEQKQYLSLTQYIQKKYQLYNIMDRSMANLFQLKKRCQKIDQILSWIDKMQTRTKSNLSSQVISEQQNKGKSKIVPIDSSFIYLPIHSGTVFHEILKDCTAKDKQKGIGEYRNPKLKQLLESMKNIQNFAQILQGNIL